MNRITRFITVALLLVLTLGLFDSSIMLTNSYAEASYGWKNVSGRYYYVGKNGENTTGWLKVNGLWYYFNRSGQMVTGTQDIGGSKYEFNSDGTLKSKIAIQKNSDNKADMAVVGDKNYYYDKSGNLLGTGKKYISNASAYTGDTITATGDTPRWGTIAVDPKVIPLGSKVYVPYFDKVFIANDTGGIIRGTMIDIFMKSATNMNNFGRRNLEIVVLDK